MIVDNFQIRAAEIGWFWIVFFTYTYIDRMTRNVSIFGAWLRQNIFKFTRSRFPIHVIIRVHRYLIFFVVHLYQFVNSFNSSELFSVSALQSWSLIFVEFEVIYNAALFFKKCDKSNASFFALQFWLVTCDSWWTF